MSTSELKRKLKPCGDRVLVKLKPTEKVTGGGIVLLEESTKRDQYATQEAYVVDLGPDAFRGLGSGQPWCKVGDLVKISKYSGDDDTTIEDDVIYRIISDENIFGVYEGEGLND